VFFSLVSRFHSLTIGSCIIRGERNVNTRVTVENGSFSWKRLAGYD